MILCESYKKRGRRHVKFNYTCGRWPWPEMAPDLALIELTHIKHNLREILVTDKNSDTRHSDIHCQYRAHGPNTGGLFLRPVTGTLRQTGMSLPMLRFGSRREKLL
jgi:hypothetical protein